MMPSAPSRTRYSILGLSFCVAFVMYLDRACIATTTPAMMREFGVDKVVIGWAIAQFNLSYSLFQIPGGWLADRYGSRLVLTGAIVWWSLFTAGTGLAWSIVLLGVMRALFGAGEAAAWPAAARALGRWLPDSQRGFGQGFQHSGSRLGAALAPAIVAYLLLTRDWREGFYILGASGSLIAIAWSVYSCDSPRDHPGVNQAELELLGKRRPLAQKRVVPWSRIVRSRDLWLLSSLYFCYGWVLWMYMTWLPTYLTEERHFSGIKVGLG